MLNVYVKRLNGQAIIPTKAHRTDAGWDLHCDQDVKIGMDPQKVSLGLCFAIPEGYFGKIEGRSGLAMKGVMVSTQKDESGVHSHEDDDGPDGWEVKLGGIIDPTYRGPVFPILATTGLMDDVQFKAGDKVAQMLILPIVEAQMIDMGTRDLPDGERGTKGFGDSDRVQMTITGTFYPGPQDSEFWSGPPPEVCKMESNFPNNGKSVLTSVLTGEEGVDLPRHEGETLEHYIMRMKAEVAAIQAREKNPGSTVTLSDDYRTMTITRPQVQDAPPSDDDDLDDLDDDDDDLDDEEEDLDDLDDLDDEEEDTDLDDDDNSATLTVGGVTMKVSGLEFRLDSKGGFTSSPTSFEMNQEAAQFMAAQLGIWNPSEKPQDAPGQHGEPWKVESPQVSHGSPYGKPQGWLAQTLKETRSNLKWGDASHSTPLADFQAQKEDIAKKVGPGVPIGEAFGDGPSRLEVQRDFWKKEHERVCGFMTKLKSELSEVREAMAAERRFLANANTSLNQKVLKLQTDLDVARTQLEKKDTVSGAIYRAYKNTAIDYMDKQDARIQELENKLKASQAYTRNLQDVLNTAFDALGKPSPFFEGSKVAKKPGF
jgi:dUTP pyrophosphatase